MDAFDYQGLTFGGPKKRLEDGYITLLDFPVPVVLPKGRVYVVRAPLYIPQAEFGIPTFETSEEFSDWLEREGRESLLPILLDLAREYAGSPQGVREATRGVESIFGF
jgi:hypothetical protein